MDGIKLIDDSLKCPSCSIEGVFHCECSSATLHITYREFLQQIDDINAEIDILENQRANMTPYSSPAKDDINRIIDTKRLELETIKQRIKGR